MLLILFIALFTLIIHAAESLSYSVRLAGVRTGKYAVALSLTGVIVLVSRTSNMIQAGPMGHLADQVKDPASMEAFLHKLRGILAASSLGTLLAMLLFPTFVRLAATAVNRLEISGSMPRMLLESVSFESLRKARRMIRPPEPSMLHALRVGGIPKRLLLMNMLGTAIYTVGVLAALLAAAQHPEASAAATSSSGLINGLATIIMTVLVDPQVALLTDKVIKTRSGFTGLNKVFGLLLVSRLCGTLLAQLLLVPGAAWIGWVSSLYGS